MINRHLYAHASGLLDSKYIAELQRLKGTNLMDDAFIQSLGYPKKDVYWFRPLEALGEHIENSRKLVRYLK